MEKPKVLKGERVDDAESASMQTYEPEMTHRELEREAEKRSEAWIPRDVKESLEEKEEKLERDQEQARQERVHEKDTPQKAVQKEGSQSGLHPKPNLPVQKKPSVAEGAQLAQAALEKMEKTAATSAVKSIDPPPLPATKPLDPWALLHAAQDPGVFFKERGQGGASTEEEDPELKAAVEECIQICANVRGILRVGPGRNDKDEKIVVVVATRGFGESSLRSVPPTVRNFPVLVALPYELLPLKRDR